MCGRYARYSDKERLLKQYGIDIILAELRASYNIAPTQQIAALRMEPSGEIALTEMRWGFFSTVSPQPIFNARAETISSKPMFKEGFRARRCAVPADGFYEWRALDAKTKQPYFITLDEGGMMFFAGVWSAGDVECCAVVTTASPKEFSHIHDRVPLILVNNELRDWLNPATPEDRLKAILEKRTPAFKLSPVAPLKGDSPELIKPVQPKKVSTQGTFDFT